MAFKITKGNRQDGKAAQSLLALLQGLAFDDKGYLGKKLFEKLLKLRPLGVGGLTILTGLFNSAD